MIYVNYDFDNQLVVLKNSKDSETWTELKRVCIENIPEVYIKTFDEVVIPWWQFLKIRDRLSYIIRQYKENINFDKNIVEMLKKALEKQAKFEKIAQTHVMSNDDVKQVLFQKNFKRTLKDYQLRNVAKLLSLPAGASFSVPGAGKTTEALAIYCCKRAKTSKLLIVAPKNVIISWDDEIDACITNAPSITRLTGGYNQIKKYLDSDPDVSIITYHQLPNVMDLISNFLIKNDVFMILDESHRIKRGNNGKIGSSILQLSHLPEEKLILSGTPVPNKTEDLISQFNFLFPEVKVEKEMIVDMIKPIYVRTTKEELKLPERKGFIKKIEMKPNQRKLYQLLKSEFSRQADPLLKARDKNSLRKLGRSVLLLIELTSNPRLLLKTELRDHQILKDVLNEGDSAKVEYVCRRARELATEGHKTVIWSSFIENVELITERLEDIGADYIHGGVDSGSANDPNTREFKIKRFLNESDAYVLVVNPAAASEGISLHSKCHHAIYLDRNYNAAQYLQSVDRIHRLGLKENELTTIEIVQCSNSIDESVERRLKCKIDNMQKILNDPSIDVVFKYFEDNDEDQDEDQDDHIFEENDETMTGISSEDLDDIIDHLNNKECY